MKNEKSPLFIGISEGDRKKLYTCLFARDVKFDAGDEICSYNTDSAILGMVAQGKCEIRKMDKKISTKNTKGVLRFNVATRPLCEIRDISLNSSINLACFQTFSLILLPMRFI